MRKGKTNPTPNPVIVALLESALMIEAYRDTIKPQIDAIYNEVMDYMIPPKYLIDKYTGEKITDHNQLYRIEDFDKWTDYYDEARKVLLERGFKPQKPENCHLLETESLLRDVNNDFVRECCKALPEIVLQGKDPEDFAKMLWQGNIKHWNEFLEFNRKYYIQFIDKEKIKKGMTC